MESLKLPYQTKLTYFLVITLSLILMGCTQFCPTSTCPAGYPGDNESESEGEGEGVDGSCPSDELACLDGYKVKRNPENSCEFDPCPEIIECDALKTCPEGTQCLRIPKGPNVLTKLPESFTSTYVGKAICYYGDLCELCKSGECNIMESYPLQIRCLEGEEGNSPDLIAETEMVSNNSKEIVEIQISTADNNNSTNTTNVTVTNVTFVSK